MSRKLFVAGSGAVLIALTALAVVLSNRDQTTHRKPSYDARPTHVAVAHEIDDTADPGALLKASDVVVVGRVVGVQQGRTRGAADEEPMTDRVITISVTQVLQGVRSSPGSASGAEIKVVEGYWDADHEGVVVNAVDWSTKGSEGLYFLHRMDGEAMYRLTNSYGRLLYPVTTHDGLRGGPSGVAPYESVWRPARGHLGDIDGALEYVRGLDGAS